MTFANLMPTALSATLVLLCAQTLAAAPPLEEALPADVLFVAKLEDASDFAQHWETHPLITYWQNPDVRRFLNQFTQQQDQPFLQDLEAESGFTTDELMAMFPGQILLAIIPPDESADPAVLSPVAREPQVLLVLEHDNREDDLITLFENSARYDEEIEGLEHILTEEDFLGHTLYIEEVLSVDGDFIVGGYALVDNLVLLSPNVPLLKDSVARLNGDLDWDQLVNDSEFQTAREQFIDRDFFLYVPLPKLVQRINIDLRANVQDGNIGGIPLPLNQFVDSFFQASGLQEIRYLFVTGAISEMPNTFDMGMAYNDKRGLLNLIAYQDGPMPQPEFVPANALSASSALYDVNEAWSSLESVIFNTAPMLGQFYTLFLGQFEQQSGVSLRDDILTNLGEAFVSFSAMETTSDTTTPEGAPAVGQVYAMGLRDRQGMELALQRFIDGAELGPVLETTDYLGTNINILRLPAFDLIYAFVEDYLLLSGGSAELMRAAVAQWNSRDDSFWQRRSIQDAAGRLPPRPVGISYYDVNGLIRLFFQAMQTENMSVDPNSLPLPADFNHYTYTQAYQSDGLFLLKILLFADDQR